MDREPEKYTQQLAASREWKKANPERHAELARAYRARNREKTVAQNKLNYAVRTGQMERGACEVCGTNERVHAHHHDYSKPLDVRWLCFKCHKLSHPVAEEDKQVKFSGAAKARLFGEQNPNVRLTDEQVTCVRYLLAHGQSQQLIAGMFGVSQVSVSRIKRCARDGN